MADQTDAGRPAAQESFVTVEEVLRARLGTVFGGWRGAVESAVPTVLFVVVWNVTSDIPLAALSALAAFPWSASWGRPPRRATRAIVAGNA